MPTGYTYGIIEGKITTFPEFAKLCMKAFGACMHMRDDDMDKPYNPEKVSNYHIKARKEAETELFHINSLTDDEIVSEHKAYLENRIIECEQQIIKQAKAHETLINFRNNVERWTPPTKDHYGLKKFMLEQIDTTIEHDSNSSYYAREVKSIKEKLAVINPTSIRAELLASAEHDINYHTEEYIKEVERVKRSNKWVTDLLKSLK